MRIPITILLLLSFLGCKPKNSGETLNAEYQTRAEVQPSVVRIPLRIEVKELEALIEQQTAGLNLVGGGEEDRRLELEVTKADEPVRIEVFNEMIRYRIPLRLDIAYDLGLAKPRAEGTLALDFSSRFTIDSTWTLATKTGLNAHEWIEEPRVRVGGFNLPVTSIANYAVRRAEGTLERGIDAAVSQQVSLQSYVTQAWNQLQEPLLVSPENQAWLTVNPTDLRMTRLRGTEEAISADILLSALPRMTFQEARPNVLPRPFPPFSYADPSAAERGFNLYLGTTVTYTEAERLASTSVVGETFSSGNRSVRINDLKLFGRDGKMIVELATTGSYTGAIYLSGVPQYDLGRGKLRVRDLDFTLTTKSFLAKSAAWLLKGTLKKQIQDNMNEVLEDNLREMSDQLQEQLTQQQLAPGVTLDGSLDELGLADTYLTERGIEVVVHLQGQLDLDVTGLTQLLPRE